MTKKLLLIGTLVGSMAAMGASIDHIQTYTPEYLANQAQNGMINEVSGYYNPAGLTHMEEGKYFTGGLQYARGHEKMSYKGREHKALLRQMIPNIALYDVDEKGANYLTFGGIAGGGELEYDGVSGLDAMVEKFNTPTPEIKIGGNVLRPAKPKGLEVDDVGSSVTGSNKYEHLTVGRAFKVDDQLSVSVAGRLIHGTRELVGKIRLESKDPTYGKDATDDEKRLDLRGHMNAKREAYGYGVQLGINYKATDKLNLAARYDSRIRMNFKSRNGGNEKLINLKPLRDDMTKIPGKLGEMAQKIPEKIGFGSFYPQYTKTTRRDLPAILALGASYQATDNYLVAISGNYYFNKDAKMDRITNQKGQQLGMSYDNGWEIAVGNEYQLNDKWTLLGGLNYAYTGAKRESFNDTEYALNSLMYGLGARYQYDETLSITVSAAHYKYFGQEGKFMEKEHTTENQKYSKSISAFGLGFTKKM